MISPHSPFLEIPVVLDQKRAIFLDGMRHAIQIIDLSYQRLCQSLSGISHGQAIGSALPQTAHVFLDAWAFVDSVDRFRNLWVNQPNTAPFPSPYSPTEVGRKLQSIRNVRNVSAHIAQKIDQIVSLNTSVLGTINWLTVVSQAPLKIKTHDIRPGIMHGSTQGQLAMIKGPVNFLHGTGCISLSAGDHEAQLSDVYEVIKATVKFAEHWFLQEFKNIAPQGVLPADMLASAELNTGPV